jgi:hypothetical protein
MKFIVCTSNSQPIGGATLEVLAEGAIRVHSVFPSVTLSQLFNLDVLLKIVPGDLRLSGPYVIYREQTDRTDLIVFNYRKDNEEKRVGLNWGVFYFHRMDLVNKKKEQIQMEGS